MVAIWRRAWVPTVALAMSALLALAFGASGGAAVAQGTTASVSIAGFAFSPGTLQIAAGTTVTWTNDDQVAHTVTADDGSFDSGDIQPGGTFSMTFDTPGTIAYHCEIHPNMTASIVVVAAASGQETVATQPAASDASTTTTAGTPAASLPVTGSGSSIQAATTHGGAAALALAALALAAALGLLVSARGPRRR